MVEQKIRFEKHFDETYGCAYYYDHETGESVWELPEGIDENKDVKDLTKSDAFQKVEVKDAKEDLAQYKAHLSSVDQMQREALAMLYPDALVDLEAKLNETKEVVEESKEGDGVEAKGNHEEDE